MTGVDPLIDGWAIRSETGVLVLDSDFGFVRRFDFSEDIDGERRFPRSTISLNEDATMAVAIQFPHIVVKRGSRRASFSANSSGDFGSSALVTEQGCYLVRAPEVDDLELDYRGELVWLDWNTGQLAAIAEIESEGDCSIFDAGETLAVVASDGQNGANTFSVNPTSGSTTHVTPRCVLGLSPDRSWCVAGEGGATVMGWPSGDIEVTLARDNDRGTYVDCFILDDDRIAAAEDGTVTILDRRTLEPLLRLAPFTRRRLMAARGGFLVTHHWEEDAIDLLEVP